MNVVSSKDNSIQKILVNNEFMTDSKRMADQFNFYFSNIASDIVSKINPVAEDSLPVLPNVNSFDSNFSFSSVPVTVGEIWEASATLKDKATQYFIGLSSIFVKKKNCSFHR
jgi:hypothetical protein